MPTGCSTRREATTTVDVTVSTSGTPGAHRRPARIPFDPDSLVISGDGQHVAFTSDFDNLVVGDGNLAFDVFVRDFTTNTTIRVPTSLGNINGPNTLQKQLGDISNSGRYVVVTTNANGTDYVFRHDRDSDGDSIFDEPAATANVTVSTVPYLGQTAAISGDGWHRCVLEHVGHPGVAPSRWVGQRLAGHAAECRWRSCVERLRQRARARAAGAYGTADANSGPDVYRVELSARPTPSH